jgi:hypothetical protein
MGILLAASFAVGRAGPGWVRGRRVFAGSVAACSAMVAPVLLVLTSARAACGCGNAANGYQLPTMLGLPASNWVLIVIVAFPILMAATTSDLPERFRLGAGSEGDPAS